MKLLYIVIIYMCGSSLIMAQDLSDVSINGNEGCLTGPSEQFGRYLGNWKIRDYQLSQDGTTWTEQAGARWNFTCVGGGIAIQDYWMPNDGGVGTNLRIYTPDTGKWDIAWTSTGAPGLSHITAEEQSNGNIVMEYVSPIPNPPRRITFFPPSDNGWNWQQEMSFDEGKTWTVVYKIEALPAK